MAHEEVAPVGVRLACVVVLNAGPGDPDDASHFVGERDGCLVVVGPLFDFEHPALQWSQSLFALTGLAMREQQG